MKPKKVFPKIVSLVPALFIGCSESHVVEKPNIIYILADDMGVGDVSHLNPEGKIPTRHIDKIARQGISFTDAHTTSAVSTPSRYSILTGSYNWRSRMKNGVLWSYDTALIEADKMTVGTFLQQNGYHTGCVGKWHLGWTWATTNDSTAKETNGRNIDYHRPIKNGPTTRGFDYFYGFIASLDIPPYMYVENEQPTTANYTMTVSKDKYGWWRNGHTGEDFDHWDVLPNLTRKAVAYIDRQANKDKPFFLYFPLPAPHTPILPTEEYQGKSGLNPYGDFVLMVDDVVGEIHQALAKNGIENNTMLIFTTDNGCSPTAQYKELAEKGHHPSSIYRGHKADIFEGGHRVPFVVQWLNEIKPGQVSHTTISQVDLLATVAGICKKSLPNDAGEDSYNLLPVLLDDAQTTIREATVHHSVNGSYAIRKGDWKLCMCPGSGGWSFPRPGSKDVKELPPVQLYNLKNDPSEKENLALKEPQKVEELKNLLVRYIKEGRSTAGEPLPVVNPGTWQGLKWLNENP